MCDNCGFYNKYIFNNNSYLNTYLVRKVVKNNKNLSNQNLDIIISKCVTKYCIPNSNFRCNKIILKNNIDNKGDIIKEGECISDKKNAIINQDNMIIREDKYTNTDIIKYKEISCNTEYNLSNLKLIKEKASFLYKKSMNNNIIDTKSKYPFNINNSNASIINRIKINDN